MNALEPWVLVLLLVNGEMIEVHERFQTVDACALDGMTRSLDDDLIDRFACSNYEIRKCGEVWGARSVFGNRLMICVEGKEP